MGPTTVGSVSGFGCPGVLALNFIETLLHLLSTGLRDGLSVTMAVTKVSGFEGLSADDLPRS
jgi:hypothetical protein